MTYQTGQLENSLARPDSVDNIHTSSTRKLRILPLKQTQDVVDVTGTFRTEHSITEGTDVTISGYDDPSLSHVIYYLNDNNIWNRVLTSMEDLVGTGWDFDYDNGTITTGTVDAVSSEPFVKDGNNYTTVTTSSFNIPTGMDTDIEIILVLDDASEITIGWNETKTIQSTSYIKYKLHNTTTSTVYDMFDAYGKVPILKIKYR